ERARSDYEELTRALQAKYGPGTGPEPGCRAYGAGDRIVTCCLTGQDRDAPTVGVVYEDKALVETMHKRFPEAGR
ncbi:MAG: hypothetical protein AB7D57_11530, partial [Desulfovibrionaceae bacterium]